MWLIMLGLVLSIRLIICHIWLNLLGSYHYYGEVVYIYGLIIYQYGAFTRNFASRSDEGLLSEAASEKDDNLIGLLQRRLMAEKQSDHKCRKFFSILFV